MILKDKNFKAKGSINMSYTRVQSRVLARDRVHSDKDLFCIFRIQKIPEMAKQHKLQFDLRYGDGMTVYFIDNLENLNENDILVPVYIG